MEMEQIEAALLAGFKRGFQNLARLLFSFRTFCQVVGVVGGLVGGWLRPILYRDAGERALRGSAFTLLCGLIGWGWFCEVIAKAHGAVGANLTGGSRVYLLAVLWSLGLSVADWLAAMNRRKRQAYTFSRFIGFPRLLPVSVASYPLPPIIVFVVGLGLWTWKLDQAGGIMLMGSATAILVQLWTIAALRREDAFDLLDANWLSEDRSQASEGLSGSSAGAANEAVARAVTTADLIRRFSL